MPLEFRRLRDGTGLLLNQVQREEELIHEYGRLISMIDVEIESRRVAGMWGTDMPDVDTSHEQLQALRESIRQGDLELRANEEVEEILAASVRQIPPVPTAQGTDDDVPPIPLERAFDDLGDAPSWDYPTERT